MTDRIARASRLGWIPIDRLVIDPACQRKLRPGWVATHVPVFDPEKLGFVVVAPEDDKDFLIDGQHRVELMRSVGWADQAVQCEVYEGLTRVERAELFLARNDRIAVREYDKFRIRITAGDDVAKDIDRIVRSHGLHIGDGHHAGHSTAVRATSSLEFVYRSGLRNGAKLDAGALGTTLTIVLNAWGANKEALSANIIRGLGLVVIRYQDQVDAEVMARRLAPIAGGPNGLLSRAYVYRDAKGKPMADCVAGTIVDHYNRGRRGSAKLPAWW